VGKLMVPRRLGWGGEQGDLKPSAPKAKTPCFWRCASTENGLAVMPAALEDASALRPITHDPELMHSRYEPLTRQSRRSVPTRLLLSNQKEFLHRTSLYGFQAGQHASHYGWWLLFRSR